MERSQRASLNQHEILVGNVQIQYCAARRRTGGWFALGNVVDRSGETKRLARLVSGCGSTEVTAVEEMLRRVTNHA